MRIGKTRGGLVAFRSRGNREGDPGAEGEEGLREEAILEAVIRGNDGEIEERDGSAEEGDSGDEGGEEEIDDDDEGAGDAGGSDERKTISS